MDKKAVVTYTQWSINQPLFFFFFLKIKPFNYHTCYWIRHRGFTVRVMMNALGKNRLDASQSFPYRVGHMYKREYGNYICWIMICL